MSRCNCQKPPGGGIDCPSDSLAICRRENGECRGYCRQIPVELNRKELNNWVLRIIKNDNRSLDQSISIEDQEILENRQFVTVNPDRTQVIIRFDLPDTDEIRGAEQYDLVEV